MHKERWHQGHNIAGFLPEAEVACLPSWQEGAEALRQDMREYAEDDDELAYGDRFPENMTPQQEGAWWNSDEVPVMLATVDAMFRDDPPEPDEDVEYVVEDRHYNRIAFWLLKIMCEGPESHP